MPSRRTYLRTCLAAAAAGFAGCLDEPDPGPATDGTPHTGSPSSGGTADTETSTPTAGDVAWRRSLPEAVAVRPTLAGERLVAGCADGSVVALHADAGRVDWEATVADAVQGSPVVAGDAVLAVSGDLAASEHETLHALDVESGDERWTFGPNAWWLDVLGTRDGTAFVATTDDSLGPDGQTLYALSTADGSKQWSVEVGDNRGGVVTDETVYVPTTRTVDAVGTDGTHRWTDERGEYRFNTLTVAGETVAYVTADDPREPRVHGLDAATGEHRWTFDDWRAHTTRAAGDRLLVGGEKVARLDPATGEPAWVADHQAALYDAPVADGTVYTGGRTAGALVLDDGTLAWETPLDAYVSRPAGLANGRLVLHQSASDDDRNRHVRALDAATGDKRWQFAADRELTDLVVDSGLAYAGEGSDLVALAV